MKAKGCPVFVPVLTEEDCVFVAGWPDREWVVMVFGVCRFGVLSAAIGALNDQPVKASYHVRFNNAMRSLGYVVETWVKDGDGNDLDPWGVG